MPEVQVIHGKKRQGDVMRNFSDTSKAASKLSWTTQTDLAAGLHQTVSWYSQG